jgi:hypothetical protein
MWILPPQLSSRFAEASECSTKPLNSLSPPPELFVVRNGIPTPTPLSWPGRKTRAWKNTLFGAATLQGSAFDSFADWWTSSLRVSPVSRIPALGKGMAIATAEAGAKETVQSPIACGSLTSVSPPWSSSKTCQLGFDGLINGLDLSETNYAEWVTRSLNLCSSLRQTLGRAICANACSSWPTPDINQRGAVEFWTTPGATAGKCGHNYTDNTTGKDLAKDVTKWQQKWATPGARDYNDTSGMAVKGINRDGSLRDRLDQLARQAQQWRTPTVQSPQAMRGSGQSAKKRSEQGHTVNLQDQVADWSLPQDQPIKSGMISSDIPRGSRRRLNPAFAAWLMGWPMWWTRTEPISSGASEMESYRFKLRSLLRNFLNARS